MLKKYIIPINFSENLLNTRNTWKIINQILAKPQKGPIINNLTDLTGCLYSDVQAAEVFNEYFSNVGPNLSKNIPPSRADFAQFMAKCPAHSAVFEYTDNKEIENIIRDLK